MRKTVFGPVLYSSTEERTHSLGVMLCGYVFQGSTWHDPLPWLLGLPLLVSVLPAIILSGVPDYAADKAASKHTLVVKLGPYRAVKAAMASVVLAVGSVMAASALPPTAPSSGPYRRAHGRSA